MHESHATSCLEVGGVPQADPVVVPETIQRPGLAQLSQYGLTVHAGTPSTECTHAKYRFA